MANPETRIGLDENGEARWREIQLLVNIIMPDPSCHRFTYLMTQPCSKSTIIGKRSFDKDYLDILVARLV